MPSRAIETSASLNSGGCANAVETGANSLQRVEHHAASTHVQNERLTVTRAERGSTGWKWMSSTPAAGSPERREA